MCATPSDGGAKQGQEQASGLADELLALLLDGGLP
jgi:hypothetical protein